MLSQTTEYALRAMSHLAYVPDGLVSTGELAEFTKVPSNYLAKVLQLLAKAGLVTGRRGVGGGYRLSRPSDEITMLDVINAIDPIRPIASCPLGLENHSGALCPLHRRLDEAARVVIAMFDGITLKDVLSEPGRARPLCDTEMTKKVELTFDKS
ncbi:MAG: Rrf2 family transcriptional regulator [Phycisphaerales bacterium]|nr:Rrf2 family transcriptional regulator [Phycisphaerales bacterium]